MDDTEQGIEVPKISCPPRPPFCAGLGATQMAEQLVDVPTVVSQSFFQPHFCRAERSHPSSWCSWFAGMVEVFTVFQQDRFNSTSWSRLSCRYSWSDYDYWYDYDHHWYDYSWYDYDYWYDCSSRRCPRTGSTALRGGDSRVCQPCPRTVLCSVSWSTLRQSSRFALGPGFTSVWWSS